MRFSPIFQFRLLALVLGIALVWLDRVTHQPAPAPTVASPQDTGAAEPGIPCWFSAEATAPLESVAITLPDGSIISLYPQSEAEATIPGTGGTASITARFSPGASLPAALRLEIEPDGLPGTQRILWTRNAQEIQEDLPTSSR